MTATIGACQGCGACLLTCPVHAIRPWVEQQGVGGRLVVLDHCTGCGECVEVCPVDVIEMVPAQTSGGWQ
jgi:electron transport complex protein RnfB